MQPGCGLRVRKISGHWYVYLWHFNGPERGRQVEIYGGPAGHPRTAERALRFLLEHEERARAALDRRIERYRAALQRRSLSK